MSVSILLLPNPVLENTALLRSRVVFGIVDVQQFEALLASWWPYEWAGGNLGGGIVVGRARS